MNWIKIDHKQLLSIPLPIPLNIDLLVFDKSDCKIKRGVFTMHGYFPIFEQEDSLPLNLDGYLTHYAIIEEPKKRKRDSNEESEQVYFDRNGVKIKAGDMLHNSFNDPPTLQVLTSNGKDLYLGDFETPFDNRYGFQDFWEVL